MRTSNRSTHRPFTRFHGRPWAGAFTWSWPRRSCRSLLATWASNCCPSRCCGRQSRHSFHWPRSMCGWPGIRWPCSVGPDGRVRDFMPSASSRTGACSGSASWDQGPRRWPSRRPPGLRLDPLGPDPRRDRGGARPPGRDATARRMAPGGGGDRGVGDPGRPHRRPRAAPSTARRRDRDVDRRRHRLPGHRPRLADRAAQPGFGLADVSPDWWIVMGAPAIFCLATVKARAPTR